MILSKIRTYVPLAKNLAFMGDAWVIWTRTKLIVFTMRIVTRFIIVIRQANAVTDILMKVKLAIIMSNVVGRCFAENSAKMRLNLNMESALSFSVWKKVRLSISMIVTIGYSFSVKMAMLI